MADIVSLAAYRAARPVPPKRTLHLMTQRDQPYGSVRRCCEMCGSMMVGRPDEFWKEHAYVEEERHYLSTYADLVRCVDRQR